MNASPLLGKTADQIRELLAAKKTTKSDVIAYLQGRDSLRAPSKKLLAELTDGTPPEPAPVAAEPTPPARASYTRSRTITPDAKADRDIVADIPAPNPKADYDAVVRAQGARITVLETDLKTLGAVVSSLMKTVGALAKTLGGEAESVVPDEVVVPPKRGPGRPPKATLPEPTAAPVRERTVIDPAQPAPDPTAITRGSVTKPAAERVKVIPLSDLARAATEDVKW